MDDTEGPDAATSDYVAAVTESSSRDFDFTFSPERLLGCPSFHDSNSVVDEILLYKILVFLHCHVLDIEDSPHRDDSFTKNLLLNPLNLLDLDDDDHVHITLENFLVQRIYD